MCVTELKRIAFANGPQSLYLQHFRDIENLT
ncbi:hypothetical protein PAT3040_02821, partial [Paenibacillus agaridevorans]